MASFITIIIIFLNINLYEFTQLNINIDSSSGLININGKADKYVEIRDATKDDMKVFNITEESIKKAARKFVLKEPKKVYFKNPRPDDSLYGTKTWDEMKRELTVKLNTYSYILSNDTYVYTKLCKQLYRQACIIHWSKSNYKQVFEYAFAMVS